MAAVHSAMSAAAVQRVATSQPFSHSLQTNVAMRSRQRSQAKAIAEMSAADSARFQARWAPGQPIVKERSARGTIGQVKAEDLKARTPAMVADEGGGAESSFRVEMGA